MAFFFELAFVWFFPDLPSLQLHDTLEAVGPLGAENSVIKLQARFRISTSLRQRLRQTRNFRKASVKHYAIPHSISSTAFRVQCTLYCTQNIYTGTRNIFGNGKGAHILSHSENPLLAQSKVSSWVHGPVIIFFNVARIFSVVFS